MSVEISLFDKCRWCDGSGINYTDDPNNGHCSHCRATGQLPSELGEDVLQLLRVWGDKVTSENKGAQARWAKEKGKTK